MKTHIYKSYSEFLSREDKTLNGVSAEYAATHPTYEKQNESNAVIFGAASKPNALKMSDWHTCETTHCRAGWVVTLAGESGKKLEEKTSTLHAAMMIYHASSPNIPVPPTRFFGSNAEALKDMERCAKLESEQTK